MKAHTWLSLAARTTRAAVREAYGRHRDEAYRLAAASGVDTYDPERHTAASGSDVDLFYDSCPLSWRHPFRPSRTGRSSAWPGAAHARTGASPCGRSKGHSTSATGCSSTRRSTSAGSRPGGLMVHRFDPYISPAGGHASCTPDTPWGHVRLTRAEFRRYHQEHRPYEMPYASRKYDELFSLPRLTLDDVERAIGPAGLASVSWVETRAHDHLPSSRDWEDAARVYPAITTRDLAVQNVHAVRVKG